MANIADDITELVGNTPLLRLHKFEKEAGFEGKILAKLEVFNPTGSVKDRIAKNMIEQAERDGRLKPGGTILLLSNRRAGIQESVLRQLQQRKDIRRSSLCRTL